MRERERALCVNMALLPRRQGRRHVVTGGPRPRHVHLAWSLILSQSFHPMRFVVWQHSQAWTCELKLVTPCLSCSQSGMLHGSTNRFEPCELDQNIPPERVGVLCVCSACVFMCVCHTLKPLYESTCVLCVYKALLPRRRGRRRVVTGGPHPRHVHLA
jgi:hypothetical protein